jgi:hypothetical protein
VDIEAIVARACPGSEIAEVVPRTGGQLSTVFEVRRTAANPLIVKIYAPDWAWKQAKEVHVYGLLAGLGDVVPQLIHVGDAFTVLTKLDGVPLSQPSHPTGERRTSSSGNCWRASMASGSRRTAT